MAKTVLIVTATGVVDNVIRLMPDTVYDPGPGISMLTVSDATFVGPGMKLVDGSNPPEFVAVEPVPGEQPESISATVEAIQTKQAEIDSLLAHLGLLAG